MVNNQSTFSQVQKFIDAGIARRLDLSAQVYQVVLMQRHRIETDLRISPQQREKLIAQLDQGVTRRVTQFAPTWEYPPPPEQPTA